MIPEYNINLTVVLLIIFSHWIADFIFQDEKDAIQKSYNNWALTSHVLMYCNVMLISILFISKDFNGTALFIIITFISHWVTDYYTSKIVKKRFDNKRFGSSIPNFGGFTVIGFDQFLHYLQLLITYKIIFL